MTAGKPIPLSTGSVVDTRLGLPGGAAHQRVWSAAAARSTIQLSKTITATVGVTDVDTAYTLYTLPAPAAAVAYDVGVSRSAGPILIEGMHMVMVTPPDGGASTAGKPNLFRLRGKVGNRSMIDVTWDDTEFSSLITPGRWIMDSALQTFTSPAVVTGLAADVYLGSSEVNPTAPANASDRIFITENVDQDIVLHLNMSRGSGSSAVSIDVNLYVDIRTYPVLRSG